MASGLPIARFFPANNEPPTSNAATADLRNNHPILAFVDSANQIAIFTGYMPAAYGSGGVTIKLGFSAVATTGDVDWLIQWERIGTTLDIDADNFATGVSVIDTAVPGTSGVLAQISFSFSNTQIGGTSAGELFRLKVTNDAATDTRAGNVELHYLVLTET